MTNKASIEPSFFITTHAQIRMQQRSFSESDLSTIARCGTVINDQEILLTNKDVEREASQIRVQIKSLEPRVKRSQVKRCGTKAATCASDSRTEIDCLRQQIVKLERLRNRKIVLNGSRVVTCYHCSKSELKRISRIIN